MTSSQRLLQQDRDPRYQRTLEIVVAISFATSILAVFLSKWFDFMAESMSSGIFLHLSRGGTYNPEAGELPFFLSAYSPFFYWLVTPFVRMANAGSVETIIGVSRAVIGFAFVASVFVVFRLNRHISDVRPGLFWVAMGWVALFVPGSAVSIRVDYYCVLMECLGFYAIYLYEGGPTKGKWRLLALCGAALAAAALLKFNSVGVLAGVGLYLVVQSRIKDLLVVLSGFLLVFLAGVGVAYSVFGDVLHSHFLAAAATNLHLSSGSLQVLAKWFLVNMAGMKLFYFGNVWVGLLLMSERDHKKSLLFALCLIGTFLLASVGQLKVGAAENYYETFYFISVIPLAIGLQHTFESRRVSATSNVWAWGSAASILVTCFLAILLSVMMVFGEASKAPFSELRSHLDSKHPGESFYTQDARVSVLFFDRVLLGPLTESTISVSQRLMPLVPPLQEALAGKLSLAVISGPMCHKWTPRGNFRKQLHGIENLSHRIGNFCIFTQASLGE